MTTTKHFLPDGSLAGTNDDQLEPLDAFAVATGRGLDITTEAMLGPEYGFFLVIAKKSLAGDMACIGTLGPTLLSSLLDELSKEALSHSVKSGGTPH